VIRVAGIDAPEREQQFGQQSAANLSRAALNKPVTGEYHKQDRYGRLVGKVMIDGTDIDLMQISAGLAWQYKAYVQE